MEDCRVPKKTPLLRKFDIPIERLDFSHVRKCSDVKELEKILMILRSGEEGHYPELMTFVEQRLKEFDPTNRLLRSHPLPVLRSQYLDKDEREDIIQDISEWIQTVDKSSNDEKLKQMMKDVEQIPIRGQQGGESSFKPKGTDKEKVIPMDGGEKKRIKSWEYDKWDKFDVDEELTKLDVLDMQMNEWEKVQKMKMEETKTTVQKHEEEWEMKSPVTTPTLLPSSSISQQPPPLMDVSTPSFMEEIIETDHHHKPAKQEIRKKVQPLNQRRKFRVEIEDVHVGF